MGFCRVSYRNAFIPLVALMALFSCSTYAAEADRGIQVQMSKAGERVDDSWQMDFKNYYYLAWDAVTNKEIDWVLADGSDKWTNTVIRISWYEVMYHRKFYKIEQHGSLVRNGKVVGHRFVLGQSLVIDAFDLTPNENQQKRFVFVVRAHGDVEVLASGLPQPFLSMTMSEFEWTWKE